MIVENEDGSQVNTRTGEYSEPRLLEEGLRPALHLSTAHMPESKPDFGGCKVLDYNEGYVVFVVPGPYQADEDDDEADARIPEWLKPIMAYAYEQGCILINFDCDEERVEKFQAWNW